jgi:malonate decarboxylase gamma subunit
VFAPGAKNYLKMGGLDALWEGDLSACLTNALADVLAHVDATDHRRKRGYERGGRLLADSVVQQVLSGA